jgi:steroid 5-alpha reductase family enzyme
LWQWGCFASNVLYNWTAAGPVFLILLFQGSTSLTEDITAGKYPGYKDYQQKVGTFVPMGFRKYEAPVSDARKPKVIRTSELEKKIAKKRK